MLGGARFNVMAPGLGGSDIRSVDFHSVDFHSVDFYRVDIRRDGYIGNFSYDNLTYLRNLIHIENLTPKGVTP